MITAEKPPTKPLKVPGTRSTPEPTPEFFADQTFRLNIIQLGKFGDIINILPVCREIYFRSGKKPRLIVAQKFASVLDGVSYVIPEAWAGNWYDVATCREVYSRHTVALVVAQIGGLGYGIQKHEGSFSVEAWRRLGYAQEYNRLGPVVFDNRDFGREHRLLEKCQVDPDKPLILSNFASQSSPLDEEAYTEALASDLRDSHHDAQHIDLAAINADRIYDLLALMDRATLLITADTGTLHLAAASNVPTVALITDSPSLWHGTEPRCNIVDQFRYSFTTPEIVGATAVLWLRWTQVGHVHHVYSRYLPSDSLDSGRQSVAEASWRSVNGWEDCPITNLDLPRTFDDGDRRLPYLKDLVDEGLPRYDDDFVVLTNSDTCVSPRILDQIGSQFLEGREFMVFMRRDFGLLECPIPHHQIADGAEYPGADAFAFTRRWWTEHRDEIPDLVLGAEGWDLVLRNVDSGPELPNLVYHQRHFTRWEHDGSRQTRPSQIHNRRLTQELFYGGFQS